MSDVRASDLTGGAICGCDCECSQRISDGNLMTEDVTDEGAQPWEQLAPDGHRVHLVICAECFVGNHALPLLEEGRA
jgi:hypothetical protein